MNGLGFFYPGEFPPRTQRGDMSAGEDQAVKAAVGRGIARPREDSDSTAELEGHLNELTRLSESFDNLAHRYENVRDRVWGAEADMPKLARAETRSGAAGGHLGRMGSLLADLGYSETRLRDVLDRLDGAV